jgi:phosphatidylglycerophosphate synthase
VAAGVTPNVITSISLALGAGAGIAMWQGAFGVGALLSLLAGIGDALDGQVARLGGRASDAGEVFDAAADRYVELFFLGGIVLHYTGEPAVQALALATLGGSFMVSYSSAKAEALLVTSPRVPMRRPERAVYLTMAAALTPLLDEVAGISPLELALALVAVVANVSAVQRLASIARERAAQAAEEKAAST